MGKELPPRADLHNTIATLRTMPAGSVIEGAAGALERATACSIADLENDVSNFVLSQNAEKI